MRDYDKDLNKELREKLRDAGRLVQQEASQLLAPISPVSARGFKVRVRVRGVAVEQSRRRTTGQHPEFGVLQMQTALLPALDAKQGEVEHVIETMLDTLGRKAGF